MREVPYDSEVTKGLLRGSADSLVSVPWQPRAPRTAPRQGIRVVVPDEPPILTPRAARALLRALVEAKERDDAVHTAEVKDGRSV